MDRESLRALLDNLDAQTWKLIDVATGIDEIRVATIQHEARREQMIDGYIDASFNGEEAAEEEETAGDATNGVPPGTKTRAGRGEDAS